MPVGTAPLKKERQTRRHRTNSPFWISLAVPGSERGVCRGGVWGLFWWREQQRQKSIFARVDGNSLPFLSRGAWLLFLSADFCRGCPLSLARIPPSLPLFWSSLSLFLFYRDGKPKEWSRSESCTVGNSASTTWLCAFLKHSRAVTFPFVPH